MEDGFNAWMKKGYPVEQQIRNNIFIKKGIALLKGYSLFCF